MFSVGASCKCPSSHRRMSLSSTWLGSSASGGRQFRFPDSGASGKLIRDYAWKAKAEYFGVDLKTNIEVESEMVGPCSKIKGHLVIDTKFPIEHDGIFIQLEALCSLNYNTKHKDAPHFAGKMHKGKGCILENTKVNEFGLQESPVKCEIIPVLEFVGHSIESGVWDYPFQLISCSRLPTPFENTYGNLDYRLVVYMISHSSATYVKLAEKKMSCDGYYNLSDDLEESSKPIVIEQYYRKSYFSQKKQVKSTLSVSTTGFLPQEDIPITFTIKNPKCTPLHLSVNLLQHVKYQATNLASLVKIVTTVASQEKDECDEPKPEVEWISNIRVPENLAPTYACSSMYNVNYVLEVKSLEEEVILSGQARILLGTTREPIKQEQSSSEDSAAATAVPQPGDLYRSGSESSIHSQRSIYSTPIAYSVPANLNLSIDEPDQDEEEHDENDQQQQEQTSSSNLLSTNSPSPRHHRSQSHHDITETLQEVEEDNEMEPFLSAPYMTTSEHSLLSAQTATQPPSYSTLSSRLPSTETLPPTYADLDLNVDPPASLIIGDAVDLEKRYSINLDILNLQDEYQVTFYSV